jgi:hypothetical protein
MAVGLGRLVGTGRHGDAANGRLRRQSEVIPQAPVNDFLQVELANLLWPEFLEPQLRRRIAGSVARLTGLPKQFRLVLRRRQLDVGHQLHDSIMETGGLSIKSRVSCPSEQELRMEHPRGGFR